MNFIDKVKPYTKAVMAFVAPGVTVLIASMQDGSDGGSAVTTTEWLTVLAACLVTTGVVYVVPNTPAPPPTPFAGDGV